jgi:hypothetical protein
MRQAGHPESWLCSIFAHLSDDLAAALRDAWLASMVLRREASRLAERSAHNQTRRAVAAAAATTTPAEVAAAAKPPCINA